MTKGNNTFTFDTDTVLLKLVYKYRQELYQRGSTCKAWLSVLQEYNDTLHTSIAQSRTLNNRFKMLRKDICTRILNGLVDSELNENEKFLVVLGEYFSHKPGKITENEKKNGLLIDQSKFDLDLLTGSASPIPATGMDLKQKHDLPGDINQQNYYPQPVLINSHPQYPPQILPPSPKPLITTEGTLEPRNMSLHNYAVNDNHFDHNGNSKDIKPHSTVVPVSVGNEFYHQIEVLEKNQRDINNDITILKSEFSEMKSNIQTISGNIEELLAFIKNQNKL